MLVVPNQGAILMLQYIVNNAPATDLILRLFTNNVVPDENTTVGMLTEASSPGYSAITLTGSDWSFDTTDDINEAVFAPQVFTMTAAINAYGYYLTDSTGEYVMWIERFPTAPYILPSSGGTITITPRATLS